MIKRGFLLKDKRGFDLPFSWIFAMIVGAAIIFLAIYGATQFISTAKYKEYTEAAKSITIITDPLETGIASNIGDIISFKKETRTYYNCFEPTSSYVFGKQTLAFSEQSGIGKAWEEPGGEITIKNKFIFADKIEEGKNLYLFSKPFFIGFKVSDLIEISSEEYCFIQPPEVISEEISGLSSMKNMNISSDIEECPANSKIVCFNNPLTGCNINVYDNNDEFQTGYVVKDYGKQVYYIDSLIYSAIFSAPAIYECNIKRLGVKISELAKVYADKTDIVRAKNCNSLIKEDLMLISESAKSINSSVDLGIVYSLAKQMDSKNEDAECKIYTGE